MSAHNPTDVAAVAQALIEEGAGNGGTIHSWRCQYPDMYGPCSCVEQAAEAILDALDKARLPEPEDEA